MEDFEQKFEELIRSLVPTSDAWRGTEVRITRVVGRYPINQETREISSQPGPQDAPKWLNSTCIVAEVIYPSTVPQQEREMGWNLGIIGACYTRLNKVLWGNPLHDTFCRDDKFIIYSVVDEKEYEKLIAALAI